MISIDSMLLPHIPGVESLQNLRENDIFRALRVYDVVGGISVYQVSYQISSLPHHPQILHGHLNKNLTCPDQNR